ncbi:MAG TPA: hypothetical protein VMR34_02000 [Candidatus Saccharimonadales bacterium]|nr:hypothetical protein [Candidatus Saccharimonadales bacterium]
MSRFISTLVSGEKKLTKSIIERLELASGEPNVDIQLTSELITKSKTKISELGLDPANTTQEELYQGLLSLAQLHDKFLYHYLDASDSADIPELLNRIKGTAARLYSRKTVWTLRDSVVRKLLGTMPPKQLASYLKYRSIASMLKRESVEELFTGIILVESSKYQEKLLQKYKKLKPSDFEVQKISVQYLNNKRWAEAAGKYADQYRQNVIELRELGTVVILPLPLNSTKGVSFAILPLVLHSLNEIRLYSSLFKYQQVQPDFGERITEILLNDSLTHATVAGQPIHWKLIREHFIKQTPEKLSEVLGPHLQAEDLDLESIEESLFKMEPALHFWHQTDCLGMPGDDQTVSLNLIDVAVNNLNGLQLESSTSEYLKQALWYRLLDRYLEQKPLQEDLDAQLGLASEESADSPAEKEVFA